MSLTNPTYADIQFGCHQIVEQILDDGRKIDCVMGLVRGGLVPATIISHILQVPMVTATFSSRNGEGGGQHNHILPILPFYYGSILIVDDICDSGNTLAEISFHYRNWATLTAAVYSKENDTFEPNFCAFSIDANAPYIKFPWEI